MSNKFNMTFGETYKVLEDGYQEGYKQGKQDALASINDGRLQQKIVTPSKEIQVIKADDGYYGLSDVIVSPPVIDVEDINEEVHDIKVMLTDGANATPNDIKIGKTAYVNGELIVGTYKPTGTLDITSNGIYDVSEYANANVQTGSSLKKYLDITKTLYYVFNNNKEVTDLTNVFNYSDTENVTNMKMMCQDCSSLTAFPLVDMRNVTTLDSAFFGCSSLKSISFSDLTNCDTLSQLCRNCSSLESASFSDTSNVKEFTWLFGYCTYLSTVSTIDLRNATSVAAMFNKCTYIENIKVINIKLNLEVGWGSITSSAKYGHLLTLESLLGLCQECINVGSSRTLTVGSHNMNTKLANVYVKLTGEPEEDETLPKLPMVQCESTDEGAMLISEYMVLKNWTLG